MIEPYPFVRAVTIALAAFWSLRGWLRVISFARRWERRITSVPGLSRAWLRRRMMIAIARTTLLDPVNLALMLALLAVWTVPRR